MLQKPATSLYKVSVPKVRILACYKHKQNSKAFWIYSHPRLKTRSGIDDLQDGNGVLKGDDEDKAEILNHYCSSIFTVENMMIIPKTTRQF